MSTEADIVVLYWEFTDALTEVLAENAVGQMARCRSSSAVVCYLHAFCGEATMAVRPTHWDPPRTLTYFYADAEKSRAVPLDKK